MPHSDSERGRRILIPADISPADARGLVEEIRSGLGGRRKSLSVELGDETDEPCISAMQILLSLQNTQTKVAINIGKRAKKAIESFLKTKHIGMTT